MSRRREVRDEERALWDEVTRDVRRVRIVPAKPVKQPAGRAKALPVVATGAAVPTAAAPRRAPGLGMDGATAARLKRGKVEPEARLDLHGLTQAQAHARLVPFIRRSHEHEYRCVLVITGKGAPGAGRDGVLRSLVPRWLEEEAFRGAVVGVQPAHAKHGGAGALYVYLRRKRSR